MDLQKTIKRILMEDKKMSPYFRRRIDLKQFEEQLNKLTEVETVE